MTIAVYIPSCNQKAYLREAIDSVLAQTRSADQIIVVDDASSDGSQEMIRSYASRYPDLFTTIFHDVNQGVAAARNDALRAVRCELVTYVDGDDVFHPQKLQREEAVFTNSPAADIVFSNHGYMSGDGRRRLRYWAEDDPPPEGEVFVETVVRRFPQNTLFRNELLPIGCMREVGGFDPALATYEDYDLRIRLTKRYRTAYCPHVNGWVREHSGPRLSRTPYESHFSMVREIIRNNRVLWEDLPSETVREIDEGLEAVLGNLARLAARELTREGKRAKARAAWREAQRRGVCPMVLAAEAVTCMLPVPVQEDLRQLAKCFAEWPHRLARAWQRAGARALAPERRLRHGQR
jgi:glycosyltransferase involved in cell wall biosynthesis